MIVIKHRQTDKRHTYNAKVFFKHNIDLSVYEIIEWQDVVELFDKSGASHGIMEHFEAEKIINTNSAVMGYRMVEVLRPIALPINMPIPNKIAPHETNNHAGTSLLKKSAIMLEYIYKNTVIRWIIKHLWLFIFGVAIGFTAGFVLWYYTIYRPIFHH
jgi:hypothetical protein